MRRSAVRSRLAPPPAFANASAGEAFAGRVSAEALAKADSLHGWQASLHALKAQQIRHREAAKDGGAQLLPRLVGIDFQFTAQCRERYGVHFGLGLVSRGNISVPEYGLYSYLARLMLGEIVALSICWVVIPLLDRADSMGVKTNKLNICLIKPQHVAFDAIIEEGTKAHVIDGVGTFYAEDSFTHPPDWVEHFFGGAVGDFTIYSASSRGVLLVKVTHNEQQRIFAIIFGLGRHLLRDDVVEERFGLKVVLNSVVRDSLRSIDKTTLGSVPKQSREQMSRESEASSFGIDIEQDLVNAVTGRSNDPRLGKIVSGRDALALSVKVDVNDVLAFLPICIEKFESTHYRADFEWIDQIKDVRDYGLQAQLNGWLIDKLNAEDLDRIWMAAPAVLDWVDVQGFRYGSKKRAELHDDLDVATFLETLDGQPVSLDLLKDKAVYAISAKSNDVSDNWSAYRCLYAEAHVGNEMYVLNGGKWYNIAASFTHQVMADFTNLGESNIILPAYSHENEGAYNEEIAVTIPNACCMDRKLISFGGGHSTIEFCDILTADKRLIHVKRYGGSAQFSHLFNQGVVSGELFLQEQEFRQRVNDKLPDGYKFADVAIRPDPRQYEIVFAIISKSNNRLDLPFFSKVGLRNARRRLEAYGYKVTKLKISNLTGA
jgi:uncharacterized protein (TIGR04141 family)